MLHHQISTFTTNFFYSGLGLYEDRFIKDARKVILQEHLEWPIYRRLVICQYAVKMIFGLGLSLVFTFATATVARFRKAKRDPKIEQIMFFSFLFISLSGFLWYKARQYVNQNLHSSFLKILLSLHAAPPETTKTLLECLQKHGTHIDCLDLIPPDDCTPQELKDLCLADDDMETLINTTPNLTQLGLDARQLTTHSLNQFAQKIPHLSSLDLMGELDIPDRSYQFLTELKHLKKLTIKRANHLTQEGFATICKVAETGLNTLHLGSDSLNIAWLIQFSAIQSNPRKLGFYSPHLSPLDFKTLFRLKNKIDSLSFTYLPNQDQEIAELKKWLNLRNQWDGYWVRSNKKDICTLEYREKSDD
jgi:hypothetical protein